MVSKKLIKLLFVFLIFCQVSCTDSSNNDNSKELIGRWVSNCYELKDGDTGLFIAYILDNLVIADDSYILNNIGYTDIACTIPNGDLDSYGATYILGDQVNTTDGTNATRITLTSEFDFFGQTKTITTESIYRVTGVELNFGEFNSNTSPSLNFEITYIKQ